jgi:hypothetical protein
VNAGVFDAFPSWFNDLEEAKPLYCKAPGALEMDAGSSPARRHAQKAHILCAEEVCCGQ